MNRAHSFVGKRAGRGGLFARLAALTTVVTGLAPGVYAQDADIVGPLTENVRCFGSNAKEDLGYNIKKLELADDVIAAALGRVAADETRCEPMRVAAAELASTYIVTPPPTEEERAAEASRQMLAETLAEADRHVGALKFETGPPPRNMTRNRTSASGFRP